LLPHRFKLLTLTFDNGNEFVANILEESVYGAHPYQPVEKPMI